MDIASDMDIEKVFFGQARRHDESYIAYCARKQNEFQRYESYATTTVPTTTQGKLLLRQAPLKQHERQKVDIWLEGERTADKVVTALAKLDM